MQIKRSNIMKNSTYKYPYKESETRTPQDHLSNNVCNSNNNKYSHAKIRCILQCNAILLYITLSLYTLQCYILKSVNEMSMSGHISHPKTYSVRIMNKVVEKLQSRRKQHKHVHFLFIFCLFAWNNFHKVTATYTWKCALVWTNIKT